MKHDRTAVEVANGDIVYTEGIGTVGMIDNVYYIPGFGHNLISVVQLNKRGFIVQFDFPTCTLINKAMKEEQEIGQFINGLYQSTHTVTTKQAHASIKRIAAHDI
jgi:glutathione peroxidase-family protein